MVVQRPARKKDTLQRYYTVSDAIVSYMVSRLHVSENDTLWEPCVGGGHLIRPILAKYPSINARLSDVDSEAICRLQETELSSYENINICCEDSLSVVRDSLFEGSLRFTRVIANPPYGAWFSPDRRQELKRRYKALYVKESYAVFLYHCTAFLAPSGRLVFIVPDTFLWLNRHRELREHLFCNFVVEELCLFPSRCFEGVSFGYSGMCIISLTNIMPPSDHQVVVHECRQPSEIMELSNSQFGEVGSVKRVAIPDLLNGNWRGSGEQTTVPGDFIRLEEVAEAVTGFYSGNDTRWLRCLDERVRGASKYRSIENTRVFDCSCERSPPLDGLLGERCFVPIVKGGASPFWKGTAWCVDWSSEAVQQYRARGSNPARFQNATFYFKQGIAVPMVSSTKLTAALLDWRLFDQSIVGVFPKSADWLFYLLGYLNSNKAHMEMRRINPTANNSANYLKRLPVPVPSAQTLRATNELVAEIIAQPRAGKPISDRMLNELEEMFK